MILDMGSHGYLSMVDGQPGSMHKMELYLFRYLSGILSFLNAQFGCYFYDNCLSHFAGNSLFSDYDKAFQTKNWIHSAIATFCKTNKVSCWLMFYHHVHFSPEGKLIFYIFTKILIWIFSTLDLAHFTWRNVLMSRTFNHWEFSSLKSIKCMKFQFRVFYFLPSWRLRQEGPLAPAYFLHDILLNRQILKVYGEVVVIKSSLQGRWLEDRNSSVYPSFFSVVKLAKYVLKKFPPNNFSSLFKIWWQK